MIEVLKPYKAYASELEWVPAPPDHWHVVPAMAAFRERQVKNAGLVEKRVLSLSYGRIIVKPEEKLRGLVPESFETYQIVVPGNIIVRTTDLQNDRTSLRVGQVRDRGIITSAYMCLEVQNGVLPEFGYQLLNAYDHLKVLYGYGSGLRQSLDFKHIKRMRVAIPPPDEQAAIVRFLDQADRRIRRYIRAKQKLIKLLEEQKQAIIHQAVTRGLDPSVPMKDSGVSWLGAVPDSWSLRRMWTLARVRKERNPGDHGLLSVFLDRGVIPYAEGGGQVHAPSLDLSRYQVVRPGDFVLNNQQAWRGSVGVSSHHGIISPAYIVLAMSTELDSTFANYLLRSRVMVDQFVVASRGVGDIQRQVYWPHLRSVVVPVPTHSEQQAIVRHIEEQTAELTRTGDVVRREVELVRELRTRLIADVVTGQLDVRAAAATLPDEPADDEPLDDDDETGDDDVDAAPEDEAA